MTDEQAIRRVLVEGFGGAVDGIERGQSRHLATAVFSREGLRQDLRGLPGSQEGAVMKGFGELPVVPGEKPGQCAHGFFALVTERALLVVGPALRVSVPEQEKFHNAVDAGIGTACRRRPS